MAKISYNVDSWTPLPVANAADFTNAGFMALQGGSATQEINIEEIYNGGLAGASSPAVMLVSRDSIIGVTLSGGQQAAFNPATAALAAPPVGFNAATTKPQRSATLHLINMSFNAFGGISRWISRPGSSIVILGNIASYGELSISSASNGSPGLMGSHIIFEPL